MSLLQDSQIENSVYICTFQCTIRQANISMKFPCSYFVEWSTSNGKSVAMTSKHIPQKNVVHFDQTITLTTEMLFNNSSVQFSRKETLVELYLVSKSRPDQNKLVGRVTIDLAKIINFQMYAQPTEFKLNFCSVQGSLILSFQLTDQKLTTMKVQDLDKSSFIDYISQIAFKPSKNQLTGKNSISASKQKPALPRKQGVSKTDEIAIRRSNPSENKVVSPLSKGDEQLYFSNRAEQDKAISSHEKIFQQKASKYSIDRIKETPNTLNKKSSGNSLLKDTHKDARSLKESQNFSSKIGKDPTNNAIPDPIQLKYSIKSFKQKLFIEIPKDEDPIQIVELKNSSDFKDNNINVHIPSQQRIDIVKTTSNIDDKTKALELEANNFVQQNIANINFDRQFQNLRRQNQNKTKTIEHLLIEKQQLQSILTQMQAKQTILNQLNQSIKQELVQKIDVIRQLDKQLNEKQQKHNELQRNIQTLKQQYLMKQSFDQSAQNNINNLQQRLSLYQGQINDLNKALKQYQGKQAMYQQKFINMQHLIKNLEDSNQNYHSKVKQGESNKISLTEKLKTADYQKQQFSKKANQYKEQLQQIEQQQLKWKHQQLILNEKIAEKQKQTNFLSTEYQKLQSQISEVMFQKAQLSNSYEEVLKLYNNDHHQCEKLRSQIQQLLNNQENDIKQTNPIPNQREIELIDEISKLNQQIQFLKASLEVLDKQSAQEYHKIEAQNQKILQTNDKIVKQNQQLTKQVEKLRKDIKQKQYKAPTLKIQTTKIQQNIKKKEQQFIQTKAKDQSEKEFLKEQLIEHQSKIQNLQLQNVGLKQKIQQISLSNAPLTLSPLKSEESWEERKQQYEMRISGLNSNLEEQINQNNELSETILKYMQKQAKMKETLTVLEDESKEIFVLFQQKEHNEQTYQKMIQDLQKEIQRLKTKFYQINEESPSKNLANSPTSYQKLKQKLQNSHDYLVDTNSQLQQLNDELNEELIKLKLKYNELKSQSQAQFQKLNEQIIEANSNMKKSNVMSKSMEIDKSLRNKDVQLQTLKSHCRDLEETKTKLQKQNSCLRQQMEFLQQQKFGFQSDNNEKDIKILEMQQQIQNLVNQLQNKKYFVSEPMPANNIEPMSANKAETMLTNKTEKISASNPISSAITENKWAKLQQILIQLKQKLISKAISPDWQVLIQNTLDKSLGGQQVSKLINMQQKCRLLSKQLQKLKSQVMKSGYKNQQQKLALMNLIKPCQFIVTQLIAAAESLNLNQSSFL